MSARVHSWLISVGLAAAAAATFLLATFPKGDYDWVARVGGAGWVFLLSVIILLPTVMPLLRERRDSRIVVPKGSDPNAHEHGS
jgi:hypothetical protein